jgi:tetratricopeptide (TPR) repeat protein
MSPRRTLFDQPLLAYFLSSIWGAAITYDPSRAAPYLAFICAGLGVYYVLALMPSHLAWRATDVRILRIIIGVVPAFIAWYFILANDWTEPVEKIAWLDPLRRWLGAWQPRVEWPQLHPNVAGGVLAMWLPLQVAALLPRSGRKGAGLRASLSGAFSLVLFLSTSIGLLLSGLRGAWLSLAAAATLACWWYISGRLLAGRGGAWGRLAVWSGGVAGVLMLLGLVYGAAPWLALRPDRVQVWRNSWDLAWDYAFTGLGLGNFTMAYSSYALLVHVPHTTHAHNLGLDVWLAQGLWGLLAFAWLAVSAFHRLAVTPFVTAPSRSNSGFDWHPAAAVSLLTLLIHGLLDDVYYGYGGAGLLVLFVPFALMARRSGRTPPKAGLPNRGTRLVRTAAVAIVAALAMAPRATRAQFEANLGARSQTAAELSVYRWPQWPLQDALRRSDAVSLDAAVEHYTAALALDPGNVTANRRMGQIELSRGQFDDARRHLGVAYRRAPNQRPTRQLFGESLAVTGDIANAARLWRTLPLSENQLAIRRYWYESLGDAVNAQRIVAAIAHVEK